MSREAAERIVEWAEHKSHGPLTDFDKDADTVARAYLALLTPTEDDEKAAQSICAMSRALFEGTFWPGQAYATNAIIDALAAARAQQRDVDADRLNMRASNYRARGDVVFNGSLMADELDEHAAAIQGQR